MLFDTQYVTLGPKLPKNWLILGFSRFNGFRIWFSFSSNDLSVSPLNSPAQVLAFLYATCHCRAKLANSRIFKVLWFQGFVMLCFK